tara:strand:- start:698 stop:898 length:201 start_codon:yes stop_codon:yes gene_type:complete
MRRMTMESISKSKEPGLAALAKKAPEVVEKMGKNPEDIRKKDGGRVTTFRNGGAAIVKTNQKPHMS